MGAKCESKAEFRARMEACGLWQAYVRRREELRAEGCPAAELWPRTKAEFPARGDEPPAPTEPTEERTFPRPKRDTTNARSNVRLIELAENALTKTADIVSEVTFVATHLGVSVDAIDPEVVPSARAINMLAWYRQYANQRDFWNLVYSKMLPSKSQIEADARLVDDGRPIYDAICNCLRRVAGGGGEEPSNGDGA